MSGPSVACSAGYDFEDEVRFPDVAALIRATDLQGSQILNEFLPGKIAFSEN